MSARFYINWPLAPGPVSLVDDEAHHLAVVCRLRPGDLVTLFNGDGHAYPARLVHVARRQVDLDVLECTSPQLELDFTLEVAAPLPRGDRGQFLIEKLTELGVTTFVPLACQHSVIHPREARLEKLRRYVIEASKQCGRNVLMHVEEPTPWADYCTRPGPSGGLSILGHPGDKGTFPGRAGGVSPLTGYRLAVGPEAGFTDEEVTMAREAGWQTVSLGPRILRIETAALVLAAWMVRNA